MRTRLVGAALVTLVEAPAVYFFLRFAENGHYFPAVGCLFAGELLETGLSGWDVERRLLRERGLPEPAGLAKRHRRRVFVRMTTLSFAETALWVVWLVVVVNFFGQWIGFGFLLVLMHLKHQAEASTIRDTPYSTGLVSARMTVSSGFETAGAAGSLALLRVDEPLLAAAALAAGLAIEHVILIGVLLREIAARDIRLPRFPPARRPLPGLAQRLGEYFGGNFPLWWRFVAHVKPLHRFFNRLAINELIGVVPYRPEPLSTMAPYTSWASLTDKAWSSRHLPSAVGGRPRTPPIWEVAALFARDGAMTPCPRSTNLFTCFAQWFVDGFLRTDRGDRRRNRSNHDVDLSQLYGFDRAVTDALRLKQHGLLRFQKINGEDYPEFLWRNGAIDPRYDGVLPPVIGFDRLRPDQKAAVFAMAIDTRNVGFIAFNVLFLREHNRIARQLEAEYPRWNDDRLFATARMILIVLLLKIVVTEYINHISGYYFKFLLSPASFPNEPWYRPNWMAIEFNLLYRWHSLVPSIFAVGGRNLTVEQSLTANRVLTATGLDAFMRAASNQPAGRIGLFNTDPFLVWRAERPTIQQGRTAKLRSYNDYRALCRLPRISRFEQISASPRVRKRLRDLYRNVDDIELYVGLYAEEAGPNNVLPPLMTAMVSFDAFSQVLTNPLVAPRIYGEQTFSPAGMKIIAETDTIAQLVDRNTPPGPRNRISLTRADFERV
jgi:prostaglandin-endoperoxide synthase 2